jgi:hypothetical protein
VTEIVVDRQGRASGVRYVQGGRSFVQPASVVVLATYTHENVRLLLTSTSCAFPTGLAGRRIMCSKCGRFAIRGRFERFGRRGRQNTASAALSDWCSRLALRSWPASEHRSAAIRSVAVTAGDLWTSVQRSGVRHRDDEATAFGQERPSGELQPTRLLLVQGRSAGVAADAFARA